MAKGSVGVYAGTFDPITNGHRDIVERALKVFERVVVAVAESTPKKTLFDIQERKQLVSDSLSPYLDRVVVVGFNGLLVSFAQSQGVGVIIRGLRAVSDYEYEAQMAIINRQIAPEIETVYFVASEHCSFISSSVVKELAQLGGDVSRFVPQIVSERLKNKLKE